MKEKRGRGWLPPHLRPRVPESAESATSTNHGAGYGKCSGTCGELTPYKVNNVYWCAPCWNRAHEAQIEARQYRGPGWGGR